MISSHDLLHDYDLYNLRSSFSKTVGGGGAPVSLTDAPLPLNKDIDKIGKHMVIRIW